MFSKWRQIQQSVSILRNFWTPGRPLIWSLELDQCTWVQEWNGIQLGEGGGEDRKHSARGL
jgi:hypothetical protein